MRCSPAANALAVLNGDHRRRGVATRHDLLDRHGVRVNGAGNQVARSARAVAGCRLPCFPPCMRAGRCRFRCCWCCRCAGRPWRSHWHAACRPISTNIRLSSSGLAAKNGIRRVRAQGGAGWRPRDEPCWMRRASACVPSSATSVTFVLGSMLPLVFATGAGAASRQGGAPACWQHAHRHAPSVSSLRRCSTLQNAQWFRGCWEPGRRGAWARRHDAPDTSRRLLSKRAPQLLAPYVSRLPVVMRQTGSRTRTTRRARAPGRAWQQLRAARRDWRGPDPQP